MNARIAGDARNRWMDRLKQFDESGLTVAQFCQQEGCSPASFYQWRRKLRGARPSRSTTPAFVPVRLVNAAVPTFSTQTIVSLDLPGGVLLKIETPAALSASAKQEASL